MDWSGPDLGRKSGDIRHDADSAAAVVVAHLTDRTDSIADWEDRRHLRPFGANSGHHFVQHHRPRSLHMEAQLEDGPAMARTDVGSIDADCREQAGNSHAAPV